MKKIFFGLCILAGLNSCSINDDNIELESNGVENSFTSNKIKYSVKSVKDILESDTSKELNDYLKSKIKNNNIENHRYFENYIVIEEIPVNIIETEDLTSYTFFIIDPSNTEVNSFHNLVIIENSDNIVKYILRYNTFEDLEIHNSHNSFILNSSVEIISNNESNRSFFAGDGCTILTAMCPWQGEHVAGDQCFIERPDEIYWKSDSSLCNGGGSGNGTGTGTGNGSGTGNGGGSNNPNPGDIVTQPNIGYLYGTSGIDISNSIIVNAYQQNGISFGVPYTGWLNRNRSDINLILGYLYSNNFSTESLNNIKDFIDLVKNNPTGYTMSEIIKMITAKYEGVYDPLVETFFQQGAYLVYTPTVTQVPLPSFSSFYNSWPKEVEDGKIVQMSGGNIRGQLGGNLASMLTADSNFCSVRLSWALLSLGIEIPLIKKYNSSHQFLNQRTVKASNQKNYILDAETANEFLRKKFGPPTISIPGNTSIAQILQQLSNVNGIYSIVNNNSSVARYAGHIDVLINGRALKELYLDPDGGIKKIDVWVLQ